jgi:hypothetical protein
MRSACFHSESRASPDHDAAKLLVQFVQVGRASAFPPEPSTLLHVGAQQDAVKAKQTHYLDACQGQADTLS